jgi:hypothetical protein
MAKSHVICEVRMRVLDGMTEDPHLIEITEWRRGSRHRIVSFAEVGPFGIPRQVREAVLASVASSCVWAMGDALELDMRRMV